MHPPAKHNLCATWGPYMPYAFPAAEVKWRVGRYWLLLALLHMSAAPCQSMPDAACPTHPPHLYLSNGCVALRCQPNTKPYNTLQHSSSSSSTISLQRPRVMLSPTFISTAAGGKQQAH